jgi:SpoVK/Ycf46/Vps4 family AAA+-type ATPase
MVGLPSLESRELILRRLLSKEKVAEGLDFKQLATITEGYSGSDLKVFLLILIKYCIAKSELQN